MPHRKNDLSLTASKTFSVKRRPALDVRIPRDASPLVDLIDAIVDDYRPYAIENLNTAPNDDNGPNNQVRRVHFFSNDDRTTAAITIAEHFGHAGIIATAMEVADDGASWVARSQTNLRSIRVGRVVVAPPWDRPPDTSDIIPVIVNPSMGFGTGHHSTTRLCLRALQNQPICGRHVTDVGTGSGVLAITAAKLDAASVLAIENDGDAASAAQRNIAVNGVGAIVTLVGGNIHTLVTRPTSCVLANLTSRLLVTATQALAQCAEPGGTLILSGLTREEEGRVIRAFEPIGRIDARLYEGDWAALVVKRWCREDSPYSESQSSAMRTPRPKPSTFP